MLSIEFLCFTIDQRTDRVSLIPLYTHTHTCTHTPYSRVHTDCMHVCTPGDTRYLTFSDGRLLTAIIGNVLRDRVVLM